MSIEKYNSQNNFVSINDIDTEKVEKIAQLFQNVEKFKTIKTKEDLIFAIMLAPELGISPMTCITLYDEITPSVVQAVLKGKQLGFDFQTSKDKIYVFKNKDGKTCTSIATELLMTLAIRNGVSYDITRNFEPIYGYQDFIDILKSQADKNHQITTYKQSDYETNKEMFNIIDIEEWKKQIQLFKQKYTEQKGTIDKNSEASVHKSAVEHANKMIDKSKINIVVSKNPIDYITEIEFKRNINGEIKTAKHHFTYSDAAKALLLTDSEYSAWNKFLKQMMIYRAFTLGLRVFAPDCGNTFMSHWEAKAIIKQDNLKVDKMPEETFVDIEVLEDKKQESE